MTTAPTRTLSMVEYAHRPKTGGLMVAFGITAGAFLIGAIGSWLLWDRISSVRLGLLIGLAGFGLLGMLAVPVLRFKSRHDVVKLGAEDLVVTDGSSTSRVLLKDIHDVQMTGADGEKMLTLSSQGLPLQIREEWMDSGEVFVQFTNELSRRVALVKGR